MCFCISGLVSSTRADGGRLRAAGRSLSARMQWKHPPQGAVSEHRKKAAVDVAVRLLDSLCYKRNNITQADTFMLMLILCQCI